MKCFWPQCSDRKRCETFASCVAQSQHDNRLDIAAGGPESGPAVSADYQRGWDDCLERVYKVLGEKFTRPAVAGDEIAGGWLPGRELEAMKIEAGKPRRTIGHVDHGMASLRAAIEFAQKHPLPRCAHGNALRDGASERLEPTCGCRAPLTQRESP